MRILKDILNKMFRKQTTTLTKKEKKILFKIARHNGCDWDGDTLRIYVNEKRDTVEVLKP